MVAAMRFSTGAIARCRCVPGTVTVKVGAGCTMGAPQSSCTAWVSVDSCE